MNFTPSNMLSFCKLRAAGKAGISLRVWLGFFAYRSGTGDGR